MGVFEWAKQEIKLSRETGWISEKTINPEVPNPYDVAFMTYLYAMNNSNGAYLETIGEILNRLLNGLPLSPIVDKTENWFPEEIDEGDPYEAVYQSDRYSSLFKNVYPDGTIEYEDLNLFWCCDKDDGLNGDHWFSRLVHDTLKDKYPITLPYYPDVEHYSVFVTQTLNTFAIWDVRKPNGETDTIERFFKYNEDDETADNLGWVEISRNEYEQLVSEKE